MLSRGEKNVKGPAWKETLPELPNMQAVPKPVLC